MKIGDSAEVTRTFSQQDLAEYSLLSGHDVTSTQVPEPLIGALFSYLLGVKLPGLGTNYLKQKTHFQTVSKVGDALSARVEVTRLHPKKQLVYLATTCLNADGKTVANGRALVYVGDLIQETDFEI